jgi:hypothetical protein
MRFMPLVLASLLVAQAPGYKADVEKFRANRAEEIGGPTGWAALTGLHWLEAGAHSIGRAAANDVVLTAPGSPLSLGTITVDARDAILRLAPGVTATVDGKPVTTVDFHPPKSPVATMVVDTMSMTLIQRGQRLALRVWDSKSPDRLAFKGLKWYPIDPKWRIEATWTPHTPAPTLDIMNVLNEIVKMPNVGTAEFSLNGQRVKLEALLEEPGAQELFFMFRDGTSGKQTYAAGRYLYTPLPKDGKVVLDFNEAKNPPCAFTRYATCPLPPASNRLTLPIAAGELDHVH